MRTREQLIKTCEHYMGMPECSTEMGRAWAYLKAGCKFTDGGSTVQIEHPNFNTFETGDGNEFEDFLIPAPKAYTLSELIEICDLAAAVPVEKWCNRDTPDAIAKAGECRALLSSKKTFSVTYVPEKVGDNCVTDESTIWLYVGDEHFYLPTKKRLEEAAGGDWY